MGGDSILSIQVVARARRAGIELTPRQMFQHQTIAELAEVAGAGVEIEAPQGPLTGAVPLLPVQRWLFEQDLAQPEHFNQALLFGYGRASRPRILVPCSRRSWSGTMRCAVGSWRPSRGCGSSGSRSREARCR